MRNIKHLPILVFICAVATTHGADNILINPGFEQPVTTDWGDAPTSWSIGAPEPTAVHYPWLKVQWSLNGDNPEGTQIAALNGNCRQTVGPLKADTVYTLSFSVYFLQNQQFYADFTTNPWASGILRFIHDPGASLYQNMPSPLPLNTWIDLSAQVDTSNPAFTDQVGQECYVHFWSTGDFSKILLDNVVLTEAASTGPDATLYYVSNSAGSDGNDGLSPQRPWKSFSNFLGKTLGPGDQVLLKRGDTWPASKLNLTGKGTPSNPITLSAYGSGPHPIITGQNLTDAPCIVLENPSHFVVENMDCRNAKVGLYLRYTGGNSDGSGPGFNNQNVTVQNCVFQNMDEEWSDASGDITVLPPYELSWGAGIWLGGSIPNAAVEGTGADISTVVSTVTIRQCAFLECSTGFGNNWYFPREYNSRIRNLYLEDSFVTGCENGSFAIFYVDGGHAQRFHSLSGGQGFYASGTTGGFIQSSRNFTIDDCEFAFNKRNATGNDGTGFDFEGNCDNIVFTNNVIHDNDGSGLLILHSQGENTNLTIEDNVFYNNARNPKDNGQNNEIRYYDNPDSTGSFQNNGVYIGAANSIGTPDIYRNGDLEADFTVSNNRTSIPYSAVSGRPTAWEFNTAGDLEGWTGFNQWDTPSVTGGSLIGAATGVDPYAQTGPTWFATMEYETLRLRMRQSAGTTGQAFFLRETAAGYTGPNAAAFSLIADNAHQTYRINLKATGNFKGVIEELRLDPTDTPSTIAVDYLRVSSAPYLTGINAVDHQTVDIAFNEILHPSGGIMTPENFAISGAGQGTVNANPDSVSVYAFLGAPVYRLKWNAGAMTGETASLVIQNIHDARGNSVLSSDVYVFTTLEGNTEEPAPKAGTCPMLWSHY